MDAAVFTAVLPMLVKGFYITMEIAIIGILLGFVLGAASGYALQSGSRVAQGIAGVYVWIIRGTPLMLQLIIIFYGPGMWFDNNIWAFGNGRMAACVVAFVINYSCYFSVIYRGGIEGVPQGQREAGEVLGMTKRQIFFKITLLQVIKRIVPPMSNEIITLVKDTSLAFVLAQAEMFTMAKQIAAKETSIMPLMAAGLFYYIFNLIVAFAMERLEKALNYYK